MDIGNTTLPAYAPEELRTLLQNLSFDEINCLKNIVKAGGSCPSKFKNELGRRCVDSLTNKGIIKQQEDALFVPLEICFSIKFDSQDIGLVSLMAAINTYPLNFIKYIAKTYWNEKITGSSRIEASVRLYKMALQNDFKYSLSKDESNIMRYIFMAGGKTTKTKLCEHFKVENYINSWSPYGYNDALYEFSRNPTPYKDDKLDNVERTLLKLICKGVLILVTEGYYDHSLLIPREAFFSVSEIYFPELDKKREQYENALYAPEPNSYNSFSGRITEDILKLQAAQACGLIEYTQQKQIKKKCLSNLASLLKTDENYVAANIELLEKYGVKTEYNALKIISGVFDYDFFHAMCEILADLNGWVRIEPLIHFLANHRNLYPWITELNPSQIAQYIEQAYYTGFLDKSQDATLARKTALLDSILQKKSGQPVYLIPAKDKPVIVQPNLEILVPYNTEMHIIQWISQFAKLTVLDKLIHFTLQKESLIKGFEYGWDTEKIKTFIESVSNSALTSPVLRFLDTISSKRGEAKLFSCSVLIKCTGLGIKEKIRSIKKIKSFELEGLDDYLCVSGDCAQNVEKILKKNGILAENNRQNTSGNMDIADLLEFHHREDNELHITYSKDGTIRTITNCYIQNFDDKTVFLDFFNIMTGDFDDLALPVDSIVKIEVAID